MILELHVQAGAAHTELAGENAALVEFLAGYFNVPKRNVRIAAGHKSRRKRVVIEGAQWKTKNAA